jgi:hypothetical protein
MFSIGIGAAGSETEIVSNVPIGGAADTLQVPLPVRIPAGSRVSIRVRSAFASRIINVFAATLYAVPNSVNLPTTLDALGGNTSNCRGTSFSGASGTWTEITPSTTKPYQGVVIVPSVASTDIATIAPRISVGVGPAGSETEFGSMEITFNSNEWVSQRVYGWGWPLFGRHIPAGSRIAASHTISTNPERYAVSLVGIPYA